MSTQVSTFYLAVIMLAAFALLALIFQIWMPVIADHLAAKARADRVRECITLAQALGIDEHRCEEMTR